MGMGRGCHKFTGSESAGMGEDTFEAGGVLRFRGMSLVGRRRGKKQARGGDAGSQLRLPQQGSNGERKGEEEEEPPGMTGILC